MTDVQNDGLRRLSADNGSNFIREMRRAGRSMVAAKWPLLALLTRFPRPRHRPRLHRQRQQRHRLSRSRGRSRPRGGSTLRTRSVARSDLLITSTEHLPSLPLGRHHVQAHLLILPDTLL